MAQQERKQQQELRLALKQERRAQAQQGHRPYFLKKCEWGTTITGYLQGQSRRPYWQNTVLGVPKFSKGGSDCWIPW